MKNGRLGPTTKGEAVTHIGRLALIVLLLSAFGAGSALAADCQNGEFASWLDGVKRDAAEKGISQQTIASVLDGVAYDPAIISRDHAQAVFRQTFEQFSGRMVSADRLRRGGAMLKRYGSVLGQIEERYGVQGVVLVAIWGLETDFGVNLGKFATIRSLATLAYDCRRSERFRAELLDALQIVDHGDLSPGEMHGAWAGELGQTQFLPSSYIKYAVAFDGGRRDLIKSSANALASTANYLKSYGWEPGAPWTPGSLNFDVLLKWNESEVYSKTIAYFATRLAELP